jgi:hypothetical protein
MAATVAAMARPSASDPRQRRAAGCATAGTGRRRAGQAPQGETLAMNMKILIPIAIAIAVATLYLLMNAPEGVTMGGESHDVSGEKK